MSRSYKRDDDSFAAMVHRSAARRAARRLAELAWGSSAIADQGFNQPVSSHVRAIRTGRT